MAAPAAADAPPPANGATAPPPSVVVRPFRVSPPADAAADTAAVKRLYLDAMESVRADLPLAGLDDAVRAAVVGAVDAWLADIVKTDLADIPTTYALPTEREEGDSAPLDATEAGDAGGATADDAPDGATADGAPVGATAGGAADAGAAGPLPVCTRGYFFLAADAASEEPLGCVGLKPPAIPRPTPNARPGAPPPTPGVCHGASLSMELVRMAVAPTARRRGAGRALVAAVTAAATAAGVPRLHLSTSSVMGPALALYAADRWVETDRVGFGDTMPALVAVPIQTVFMEKWIGGAKGAGGV